MEEVLQRFDDGHGFVVALAYEGDAAVGAGWIGPQTLVAGAQEDLAVLQPGGDAVVAEGPDPLEGDPTAGHEFCGHEVGQFVN